MLRTRAMMKVVELLLGLGAMYYAYAVVSSKTSAYVIPDVQKEREKKRRINLSALYAGFGIMMVSDFLYFMAGLELFARLHGSLRIVLLLYAVIYVIGHPYIKGFYPGDSLTIEDIRKMAEKNDERDLSDP